MERDLNDIIPSSPSNNLHRSDNNIHTTIPMGKERETIMEGDESLINRFAWWCCEEGWVYLLIVLGVYAVLRVVFHIDILNIPYFDPSKILTGWWKK